MVLKNLEACARIDTVYGATAQQAHTNDQLRVLLYHGASRSRSIDELSSQVSHGLMFLRVPWYSSKERRLLCAMNDTGMIRRVQSVVLSWYAVCKV